MNQRLLWLMAVVFLSGPAARADELRLKDGEILFGTIEAQPKGRLHVRQGTQLRKVRSADVETRLEGEDPYLHLTEGAAALQEQDAVGRMALARYAWQHRLDRQAWRLQKAALALDPQIFAGGWLLEGGDQDRSRETAPFKPGARSSNLQANRWGPARRAALSRGGGTSAGEHAVRAGLDWLARHQDADGKLDADGFQRHDPEGEACDGQGGGHHGERVPCGYDGVTTALALMAWSTSGSTPVSGPYRENVSKALAYCRAFLARGPGGPYGMWNFGFCVQALADAYAVTRDKDLGIEVQRAVDQIEALQLGDGGWSYYMRIGDVPTTGVAGVALGVAARAGLRVKRTGVRRLLAFLDERVHGGSGRSEYHKGAERKGYTPTRANAAAALTVRALLGQLTKAPLLGKQVASITEKPVWKLEYKEIKTKGGKKVRAQIGNLYPYLWYYTTMALFERGGGRWSKWYGGLKKALLKGQRKEGSCAGSWDPLGAYSNSAGRVFVTGLCVLMLQAPYRYARAQ